METKISNPYIRKVREVGISGNRSCSMGGVTSKVIFFSLLTAVGICADVFKAVPIQYRGATLIGCAIVALITSLVNAFVPSAVPVLGSIFCLAEGYIIGWTCRGYSYLYHGIVPIALLITFFVVFTMATLYATGTIKVNQKFKAVISTLFLVSIVFSLFVFITSFFTPVLSNFFYGYGLIAFGIAIIDVVIASLYLVVDFDNIAICVSNDYEKKCEWQLGYGLVMSIIILFLRILRLVAKIMSILSDR